MFIPMLLQKSDKPLNNDEYLSELKMDGFRQIYSHIEDKKLYTRYKNDVNSRFPELLGLDFPQKTVLDGLVVLTNESGKPDFLYSEVIKSF